jgi:hypothetical protein
MYRPDDVANTGSATPKSARLNNPAAYERHAASVDRRALDAHQRRSLLVRQSVSALLK